MPRGGRRTGTPGRSYQNRTDLNAPPTAATGQPYGVRAEQIAAQRAIPIARPATDVVRAAAPVAAGRPHGPAASTALPGPLPGEVVPFDAPSQRPDEPVTTGLSVGAGAGPEANPFNNVGSPDDAVMGLRAAYAAYPSEELRMILERLDLDR